jgi:hypothetical protein
MAANEEQAPKNDGFEVVSEEELLILLSQNDDFCESLERGIKDVLAGRVTRMNLGDKPKPKQD